MRRSPGRWRSTARRVGERLRRQRHALALAAALARPERRAAARMGHRDAVRFRRRGDGRGAALRRCCERLPDEEPRGLAILALGKLGSRELNYSSDVDLILLFDPATLPRRPRDEPGEAAVRYRPPVHRADAAADRTTAMSPGSTCAFGPSPEVTPIVLPVDAAISYYESSALPWERAAFIRARAAAGDLALGQALPGGDPAVHLAAGARFRRDPGNPRHLARASATIMRKGRRSAPAIDLKRGRGGIREAEFFTQVQQLIHGGREPELRAPATLDALAALAERGAAGAGGRRRRSADAYRALRTAEHRVQMIDDRQEHRLPVDPEALEAVARLDGHGDGDGASRSRSRRMSRRSARQFDGLVSDREERLSNDPDILRSRAWRRWASPRSRRRSGAIADWRSGRARSLRSPAARRGVRGDAADADAGGRRRARPDPGAQPLQRHRRQAVERREPLPPARRAAAAGRPAGADPRPCAAAGRAAGPAADAARRADRRIQLRPAARADGAGRAVPDGGRAASRSTWRSTALRRMVGERRFALGVQLLAAHRDPIVIAEGYSDLAEGGDRRAGRGGRGANSRGPHGDVPGGELIVLGLGRLGGRALTHASDLDLIYLFDAPAGRAVGRRQAAAARPIITTASPAGSARRWRRRPRPGRSTMSTRASGRRGRRACWRSASTAFEALSAAARPGPGSIWRCAARGR